MMFVEKAVISPARCAVIPHIDGDHPEGFIDSGSEMLGGGDGRFDQRVYVSIVACRELATMIGWEDPAELRAQVADLEERLATAEQAVTVAHNFLDAIDVLESGEFRARRKAKQSKQREPVEA